MRRTCLVSYLLFAAGLGGIASEPAAPEGARQTIAEWVQTQRILSEEQARWRQEEQFLRQAIDLLEKETNTLAERLRELELADDEAASARRELAERNEAYRSASSEAAELVAALEAELRELRPFFPQPLQQQAAPLLSRLDEAASQSVNLSQRLQTVLGLLAEIDRFQRNVTLARETRELGDGTRREVRTIYLGMAHAFFVDDNARIAGTGRPSAEGWQWTRDDEISGAVARAVAILQNQRTAEFVDLPVEVAR